jgi:hypothetical protein
MFNRAFLLAIVMSSTAFGQPTATVPLDELLRLYRADEATKAAPIAKSPIRASVGKIDMVGRLLGDAIEMTAQIEVTVFEADTWVTVPLFEKDKQTSIVRLPTLEDATVAVVGGRVALLAQKAHAYRFELVFRKSSQGDTQQKVDLQFLDAAQVSLKLHYDENVFRLNTAGAADGVTLYPEAGRYALSWQRLAAPQQTRTKRPPVESLVTQVNGSSVSTLAGKTVTRLVYALRLEGVRPFDLTLPDGEALERVYLNGNPLAVTPRGQAVRFDVSPERTGDNAARVEIVLSHQQSPLSLSGQLALALPSTTWNCHELFLTLHLPNSFTYQWSGGSLAQVDEAPEEMFSYDLPTPGRVLVVHQQLVERAPTVQLKYSVDLEKSYFR